MTFEIPVKHADGSYSVELTVPEKIVAEFYWKKGDARPTPDLKEQAKFQALRESILSKLAQNKNLFKTAPSIASLRAMTPVWGMIVKQDTVVWSETDLFGSGSHVSDSDVMVALHLRRLQISRQSILPVWGVDISKIIPDGAGLIEFDFGEEKEDGDSVHSDEMEIETEEGVVCLKDPGERKRQMKAYVRDLMHQANEARMKADAAMDRFYAEFDLSESESEFSEEDD